MLNHVVDPRAFKVAGEIEFPSTVRMKTTRLGTLWEDVVKSASCALAMNPTGSPLREQSINSAPGSRLLNGVATAPASHFI